MIGNIGLALMIIGAIMASIQPTRIVYRTPNVAVISKDYKLTFHSDIPTDLEVGDNIICLNQIWYGDTWKKYDSKPS